MKLAFLLALLVPVFCFPQQPVKPVPQNTVNTLNIDMLNADLPFITEKINKTNDQIKHIKEELIAFRNQQNSLAAQKQKSQFEINQLENKTNRSQQEIALSQQLKNEIKIIDSKIEKINQQIKEHSDSISLLEIDLQIMEEKLKELEQKQKNQQEKKDQSIKDLKNDPVGLYARVKTLYDSLPSSEKTKLNDTQNKTFNYYTQLYNSNAYFKASVSKELKTNFLFSSIDDTKENAIVMTDNYSVMLTRLKEYLDLLGAVEGK